MHTVKDVHKDPPLDLVGWWSTSPPSGPNPAHLPIHQQILQDFNESAVFLAFHPSQLQSPSEAGSKFPLTIYESVYEGENTGSGSGTAEAEKAENEMQMQVDGASKQPLSIRFRELPYSVETGEAEMISVDFVARGGGNAMVATTPEATGATGKKKDGKDGGGKEQVVEQVLSPDEEDCTFLFPQLIG